MRKMIGSLTRFAIFAVRVVVALIAAPIIALITLKLAAPGILMRVVRFINEVNRIPTWGAWFILLGAVAVLVVALRPFLSSASGKQKKGSGNTEDD